MSAAQLTCESRLAGHVVRMRAMRNSYILVEKPEGVDERLILKWTLKYGIEFVDWFQLA